MPLIQLKADSEEWTEVPITEIAIHTAKTKSALGMNVPGTWYSFEPIKFSYDDSRPTRTESIDKEDENKEVSDWDEKSRRTFVLEDVSLVHLRRHFPGSPITVVTVTPPQWCQETAEERDVFEEDEAGMTLDFTPYYPEDVTKALLELARETSTADCNLSKGAKVFGTWRMSNFPGSDDRNEVVEAGGSAYFYGRTETAPSI